MLARGHHSNSYAKLAQCKEIAAEKIHERNKLKSSEGIIKTMCYMLYIGSDKELPLINPEDWKNINTKEDSWISIVKPISFEELKDNDISVKDKFKEKHVVYAGSYEGCGCGYSHCLIDDEYDIEDNPAEVNASIRSRKALYDYVKQNEISTMYGCWAGDESLPAEEEKEINPEMIIDRKFEFREKVIMRIIKNE